MGPERSNNEEIFNLAAELADPDERIRFLNEACRGDPQSRAEVEDLLRRDLEAGSFLEPPPLRMDVTADISLPSDMLGTMIGPYRLVEQIGEGGFGIVYLAEQQEPVRRRVALKIIKPGMDTREVIARFEAERQVLALLGHSGIAQVLDASATDTGRPYFVMELVKGVPITDYCDACNLTTDDRLRLLVEVCHAVQHAHQKGIIHRDLKPTNVLVAIQDGRPVTKVIDFGVAKAVNQRLTEHTLVTGLMQLVGTPLYMSPEQAEMGPLDVDTRSDIYSLGVLLYELLTGTTPFEKERFKAANYDELRRIIREDEPPKPSTRLSTLDAVAISTVADRRRTDARRLRQSITGDLDWIVMKALDKDRTRRYETANALARDIERYLSNQPVEACPPSASYRFRKFARRNRAALATISLVVAALVVGTVVSTWQAVRAARAERLAGSQRLLAEKNFQQARRAVDDYFTTISETTLLDKPGLEALRKELLGRGLRYYQDLLKQRDGDPRVRAEVAGTYLRMCVVSISLEAGDEALAELESALATVEELVREHPHDHKLHTPLAGFWNVERLFYTGRTAGPQFSDPAKAVHVLERMVDLWQTLSRENPAVSGFQNDLAALATYIGDVHHDLGDHLQAIRDYERAAEIREQLVRENPASHEYQAALVESLNGVGWMLDASGKLQEAEQYYRRAIARQEPLVGEFGDVPNYQVVLANCYFNLCGVLRLSGRTPEAEEMIHRAIEINDNLADAFPSVPSFESEQSRFLVELAKVLAAAGHRREAADIHEKAAKCLESLVSRFPDQLYYSRELGWLYLSAAELLAENGRSEEAGHVYGRAVDRFERYVAVYPYMAKYRDQIKDGRSKQIELLRAAGELQEVESVWRHAVAFYSNMTQRCPTDDNFKERLAESQSGLDQAMSEATQNN